MSKRGTFLHPLAALADGAAQAAGSPSGVPATAGGSAAAAVARVVAAVKAGAPVDASCPDDDLAEADSLAGGRRAGGPAISLPVAEASQQSEQTEVDSGSDSESGEFLLLLPKKGPFSLSA